MKRWKSSVLLVLCIGGLLLGCAALFLHGERLKTLENGGDLPLHPFSSPSYTSLSANSRAVTNHPIHNSHRTDALRGVFRAHFKNASTAHQDSKETEFNSSRLKRQLDFGSDEDDAKKSSTPKSGGAAVPTNQPLLRVIQIGTKIPTIPTSSSSSFPPSSTENSPPSPKFRKRLHRFKPPHKKSEEENKYDVEVDPEDRKNFTLEVVQVERKVVRKEDGHIPSLFTKPNFKTIEPRLLKVDDAPSVVYKKGPRFSSSSERPRPQVFGTHRASTEASSEETSIAASEEDRSRDNSDEKQVVINLNQQIPIDDQEISEEDLKDYNDGHSTFGTKGNFTHTIISRNVAGFIPNNPQTGNNNELRKRSQQIEPAYASRRGHNGRKIVIERGKVTEKYPSDNNPFKDAKSDIYVVPGGRSGSEEEEAEQPQQQVFKFTRNKKGKDGGNHPKNDLTSPAIPTSLEELYRKGHPGVLPAPRKKDRHLQNSELYGDSGEYPNPFRANPLEDDPPLKFDPESDRFYGEPIPDNKEKLAQPNSPIRVENRRSTDASVNRNGEFQDYFSPPPKRGRAANSQEEDSSSRESPTKNPDAFVSSRELPARSPDRFNYGRAYNPPEYSNDYDTAPDQVEQGDNPETNDSGLYDFVGLEDNFGGAEAPAEDDFDYGGGFAPSSFKPRSGDDRNQEVVENNREEGGRSNEDDERETTPRARNPPRRDPSKASNEDAEYDNNGRESDYGFGPAGTEEGANNDAYDNGFIHTLKEFDEEIKKLQHLERNKLLQSTPLPQQQEGTPPPHIPVATPIAIPGSSDEYKDEPPLIISSPGPLPESETGGSPEGTTLRVTDDESNEHTQPGPPTVSFSEEVGDATQPIVNPVDEDYQTERSKDYDDDTTSQSAEGEQSTQASNENGFEPLKRK